MSSTIQDQHRAVDPRAAGAVGSASGEVADLWARATGVAVGELPSMGLLAGDRPTADVEVLAGAFAVVEYELARRLHAATSAGALPLLGPGAVLAARGWATPHARRLARTGALAAEHPTLASAWAAGIITSDHVDAITHNAGPLTPDQVSAVIGELATRWGQWSPAMITRFVLSAARLLHPPADDGPTRDEADAYTCRDLSFALLGDTVILSGTLPRLEGEAVIAAIDALAERLRSTADHVPAGSRRADALVELVNAAASTGTLPTRGGLPVALTVTLDHTNLAGSIWTTGPRTHPHPLRTEVHRLRPHHHPHRHHHPHSWQRTRRPLSRHPRRAGQRGRPRPPRKPDCPDRGVGGPALRRSPHPPGSGRTTRTATTAQRKALAARDGGCIIPGCRIPAENCQAHHVTDWARGGPSRSTTSPCCAGRTTARSTSECGPSHHRSPRTRPRTPPRRTTRNPLAREQPAPWIIRRAHRTRWRL